MTPSFVYNRAMLRILWILILAVTMFPILAQEEEDETEAPERGGTEWKATMVEAGTNVRVQILPEVTLVIPRVMNPGGITSRVLFSGPGAPVGYVTGSPPLFLEMRVGLEYEGPVEVCINYSPELFPDQAADIRVLRRQGSVWIDDTRSIDREANVVCARLPSLGMHMMAVRTIEGLYEDLAGVLRQVANEEVVVDLGEPLLASREAALGRDLDAFRRHVQELRRRIENSSPGGLTPAIREGMEYLLHRIESRMIGA
jgi:hypothetical protein